MAVRPLVILPDSQLRLISKPVAGADKETRALIDDMFATMYDAPGIGLAAIQIGVPLRVVTMDVSKRDDRQEPMVMINPEITWQSEELREMEEGCLSIPDYWGPVERPDRIRVKFRDKDFKEIEMEADDVLATCMQHEIDHLNGVLFIDYLSRLKRERVLKKYQKLARQKDEPA
ncbi:MAG: peptide deformylase [Proteobacteria bacterium]|nr:peptide deformylase [Pseudomonadota bacterium]